MKTNTKVIDICRLLAMIRGGIAPEKFVINLRRKTHTLACGMKAAFL